MDMNARDYLESIIATCAKLQEHPTYLGLHRKALKSIDDEINSILDSVRDEIEDYERRNAETNRE